MEHHPISSDPISTLACLQDMYFLSSINGLYAIVVCAMMPCLYMLYASIKLKVSTSLRACERALPTLEYQGP